MTSASNSIPATSTALVLYGPTLPSVSARTYLEKVTDEVFRYSLEIAKFESRHLAPLGQKWKESAITIETHPLVMGVSTPSPAINNPHFLTPPLTGNYRVGVRSYYTNSSRRLLIDVHYPGSARDNPVYKVHPLSIGNHPLNIKTIQDPLTQEKMSNMWTRSEPGLRPISGEKFPLILFSHGNSTNHYDYQPIVEELASNGYYVVTISHPATNNSSSFANLNPLYDPPPTHSQFMAAIRKGAKDVQSVLKQIRNNRIEGFGAFFGTSIRTESVGVLGHSLGGGTALQACRETEKIRVGIDLDGAVLRNQDKEIAIEQPFLTIAAGKEGVWLKGQEDYEDWQWYHSKSPRSEIIILDEAEHTDFAVNPLFESKKNNRKNHNFIELNKTINHHIICFFNKHLKK